jgi:hypothetical protein
VGGERRRGEAEVPQEESEGVGNPGQETGTEGNQDDDDDDD